MVKQISITISIAIFGLWSFAEAADLYKVGVESAREAQSLRGTGADAVLRVTDGYLVLVDDFDSQLLEEAGLSFQLVAGGVDRTNLAIGTHPKGANPHNYPLVYREDDVCLYRVNVEEAFKRSGDPGLAPLPAQSLRIIYREPGRIQLKERSARSMDLEALIALVSRDSLQVFTSQLQAFPNRLTGSLGNRQSRDWIYSKLVAYAMDSVYLDSFPGASTNAQNVVAVKMGTTYPDHRIIVGAHRDAVSGSPGADDNGSGTAGVLEIARILKDIPTEMTFVFILFDAEEQGLYGSYHYAAEAANNGDSIVMMLNMDMIGFNQNVNDVDMYYGADPVWANRWGTIADSLSTNLTGHFAGSSSGSDHYPFQQQGYDVVFLIEYVFSSVYHSYRDSTSFMSFDYMKRIVQASLATAYDVDATYGPTPGVVFTPVGEVPSLVLPSQTTTFQISIVPGPGGSLVPGSAALHYSFDGTVWPTVPLGDLGGGLFEASLPGPLCDGAVEFYVSATEGTTGSTYNYPGISTPWMALAATSSSVAFVDSFETNLGWTVTSTATAGAWQRGVPVGGGDRGDPPTDFDGSGQCYLTGNIDGDSDIDGGSTTLTSPVFDILGGDDALIHYARWLSNDFGASPYEDYMDVLISNNNGSTWTLVERVGPTGPEVSGGWFERTFRVSDLVAPSGQMRLRFVASDLINGSVVEAGVDAVDVTVISCLANYFVILTEDLPTWTAGVPYSFQLEAVGGVGIRTWADKTGDLVGTGLSLTEDGLLSGIPLGQGQISFTATCTDEADSTVEKALTVTINAPVSITTRSLPEGVSGQAYLQTLGAIGGTGSCTWSDRDGDLAGTGLALSAAGSLSGTPIAAGAIVFTARVQDQVGSYDEEELSVIVVAPYICGDINQSQGEPNVSDLTYLVNFIFKGGPAPVVPEAADVDASGAINVTDLTRLVDFLFKGGEALTCPD